jgi:putative lipase involved disintegration of autophagic bodies
MSKIFQCLVFVVCIIPFIGCLKNVEYVDTLSGRPEISIYKVSKQDVYDKLLLAMERKEYRLEQVKDSIVKFSKRNNKGGQFQEGWVRFKIRKTALGVKVFASLYRISNPGSSTQKVTDISKTSKEARGLQGILESVKDELEGYHIKLF